MSIEPQSLRIIFEELVVGLPHGCASIQSSTDERTGDFVLALFPANPDAARIEVRANARLATLLVGRGAVFEVPKDGRYTNAGSYSDEIKLLSSGVMNGRFEEVVKLVSSKVVAATAKITLENGEVASACWREMSFDLFKTGRKVHLFYAPYCAPVSGTERRVDRP